MLDGADADAGRDLLTDAKGEAVCAPAPNPGTPPSAAVCQTVLLAEDYPLVRLGLRSLLENAGLEVVADVSDGREAVRAAQALQPDAAVLDLIMPVMNGLDAAREIGQVSPRTRCLLLSRHIDEPALMEAMRSGIAGYALKSIHSEVLIQGIRSLSRGGACLCPAASRILAEACSAGRQLAPDPLSPRERRVLQLIAEGQTAKSIGKILNLSGKTAESHRVRILRKLRLKTTADLVRYAIRRGLVEP